MVKFLRKLWCKVFGHVEYLDSYDQIEAVSHFMICSFCGNSRRVWTSREMTEASAKSLGEMARKGLL